MYKILLLWISVLACANPCNANDIYVNNQMLSAKTVRALEQGYQTTLSPGRYWYDAKSGFWGFNGGPVAGQILSGLTLGGRLKSNASNGDTGVFVNGRELHFLEVKQLTLAFGYVRPGRYWLNGSGVGGLEGHSASFNLSSAAAAGGYNRQTHGGGLMSDGSCSGYLHPDGPSVLSGNC